MDIVRFSKIGSSEDKAEAYLRKRCWPAGIVFCIRCDKNKVDKLSSGRYRCQSCGLTFSDFTGRWLGQLNVSACQWLWVIKLFEMGLSARKIGQETAPPSRFRDRLSYYLGRLKSVKVQELLQ